MGLCLLLSILFDMGKAIFILFQCVIDGPMFASLYFI